MNLKNKRVFVSGGAGFIGSEVVRQLEANGAEVTAFDNLMFGRKENLKDTKANFVLGDILVTGSYDIGWYTALGKAMRGHDIVIHMAASPFIPDWYKDPYTFTNINIIGSINIFMEALRNDVELVVLYSSSEVYGSNPVQLADGKPIPFNELSVCNPHSTYASSKFAAESLFYNLYIEQKLPVIIARQFNTYGIRDTSHPRIIPSIIKQFKEGNTVTVGNLLAVRDYTYVEDAALGVVKLIKNSRRTMGETINISTMKGTSVRELIYLISEEMGIKDVDIRIDESRLRPRDPAVMIGDNRKLKRLTGWTPQIGIKEGLKRTISWFRDKE